MIDSICAWPANGPNAMDTVSTRFPARRLMEETCGQGVCVHRLQTVREFANKSCLGALPGSGRPHAQRKAVVQDGANSDRSRRGTCPTNYFEWKWRHTRTWRVFEPGMPAHFVVFG